MCLFTLGCREPDRITKYQAPKETQVADLPDPDPERMLAAIIPAKNQAWFLKLQGPVEAISATQSAFEKFLKSFSVANPDKPTWKLPEGWKEMPGNRLRYATLQIPSPGGALELSVSTLPAEDPTAHAYVLENVNRWRRQLQLVGLIQDELTKETTPKPFAEGQAITVDLIGFADPSARMPMGGDHPPVETAPTEAPVHETANTEAGGLKYELPEGWKPASAGQFARAAFSVAEGELTARATISALPAEANDLLSNINRWRGLVKLEPVTEADVHKGLKKIEVDGISGDYAELTGTGAVPQTILGIYAVRGPYAWFIKLQGDASLIKNQKSNFEKFVASLKLPAE